MTSPIETTLAAIATDLDRHGIPIELAGQRIKVATPTHLIVYKLLAGRPRDLEDAQNVFSCNRQAIRIDIVDACLAELAPLANPAAIGQWNHMKETTP